jgi:hypothetical protein
MTPIRDIIILQTKTVSSMCPFSSGFQKKFYGFYFPGHASFFTVPESQNAPTPEASFYKLFLIIVKKYVSVSLLLRLSVAFSHSSYTVVLQKLFNVTLASQHSVL